LPQLPKIKQLIYTGSYAVYGDQNGAEVDESTAIDPASENSEILAKTEEILLNIGRDTLKVCILRLGGIYGPNRELVKIWSRVAGTTRPGDGNYPTHWIHLDDIVGAIEFARQNQLQGLYNVVDQSNYTLRELVELVCKTHHLEPIIWDESQPNKRPYNVKVSNQKILKAGYQLIHPHTLI
jgi:nucleoside-diphosphate-sugar epimerase